MILIALQYDKEIASVEVEHPKDTPITEAEEEQIRTLVKQNPHAQQGYFDVELRDGNTVVDHILCIG